MVTTGSTVAKKLNEGTTTSSPGPTPSARSPIASASVPLATPTQWLGAEIAGELRLERLHLRPEDVAAALEHRPLALGDLGQERLERSPAGEQGQLQSGSKVAAPPTRRPARDRAEQWPVLAEW